MGYHKDDPLIFCIFGKNEEKISKNLKNLESTRIKTPYLLFIVKKYGVLSTLWENDKSHSLFSAAEWQKKDEEMLKKGPNIDSRAISSIIK